jgi:hypothetical protein
MTPRVRTAIDWAGALPHLAELGSGRSPGFGSRPPDGRYRTAGTLIKTRLRAS